MLNTMIFLGNEYENFVFMNDKKKSIILAFKEKNIKQLNKEENKCKIYK